MDRAKTPIYKNKRRLFDAVEKREVKLAKILIDGGVDVNSQNENGLSPLMLVCKQLRWDAGDIYLQALFHFLLENGADTNMCDFAGKTAQIYLLSENRLCLDLVACILKAQRERIKGEWFPWIPNLPKPWRY